MELIVVGEGRIGGYVSDEEDSAEDGQSQLAHALAEEHDAQGREEDDDNQQYAKTPGTTNGVVGLEWWVGVEGETAEVGYDLVCYSPFSRGGDESYKREDEYECEVEGLYALYHSERWVSLRD